MNPLCCIAPVSLERGDRGSAPVVPLKANAKPTAGLDNPARNSSSKQLAPAQVSVAAGNPELGPSCEGEDGVSHAAEGRDGKSGGGMNGMVAGILFKWVNYGKGWRSRWFVLQDGVLSYYKLHGPDKISMGSAREVSDVRVIGEDSLRRVRREQRAGEAAGNGDMKQWKPFGEIHLKVWQTGS